MSQETHLRGSRLIASQLEKSTIIMQYWFSIFCKNMSAFGTSVNKIVSFYEVVEGQSTFVVLNFLLKSK